MNKGWHISCNALIYIIQNIIYWTLTTCLTIHSLIHTYMNIYTCIMFFIYVFTVLFFYFILSKNLKQYPSFRNEWFRKVIFNSQYFIPLKKKEQWYRIKSWLIQEIWEWHWKIAYLFEEKTTSLYFI